MDHQGLELGQVIRRKFHHKVRGLPLEKRLLQEQAVSDSEQHAGKVKQEHNRARHLAEECRRKQRIHREACAAAHERHQENGEEAFTLGFQHAGAHNARHAATEAHHHRHEGTTREPEETHEAVRNESRAGHVTRVFQERKAQEHEEDDRDEGRNRLNTGTDTVGENGRDKGGAAEYIAQQVAEAIHENRTEQHVKEINERRTDRHRNPEHQIHDDQENRESRPAVQKNGIQFVGECLFRADRNSRLPRHLVRNGIAVFSHCEFRLFAQNLNNFGLVKLHARFGKLIRIALFVAQVHERNPTGVRIQKLCDRCHLRFQNLHGLFDLVAVNHLLRERHRASKHVAHLANKVSDALFAHGRKRKARHAVEIRKFVEIQLDFAIYGNIHHVDGNHHRNLHVGKLARKEQVAFQVRRIDDVDNQARFAAEQVIDSSAFVFGICEQSVSTRKVHQANLAVAQFKVTFLLFDRHAGPVTHMLAGTRKGVKESRLTAVRVTGNCNRQKFSGSHYTLLSLRTLASSLRSESL